MEKIVKNIHQRVVGVGVGDGEGGEDGVGGGCYNRSDKGNNKLRLGVTSSSKNNKLRKLTICDSIKPLLSPPSNVNNNNINNNNNIVTPSPTTTAISTNNNTTNNHPLTY